jgi:hypothetical protein
MKIDGAMGVLVAGALSIAACTIYRDEPPQAAQSTTPRPPAPPPPPPQPPPATRPAPPPPAAPVRKVELHLGTERVGPAAPAANTPQAPSGCLDQGATTVPDCATLAAPSPSCAAFTTATQKCAAYKNNFIAKVAAASVSCLASSTAAQLCDATRPLSCAQAALTQSCPDPNVTQLCQIAAGPCKSTPAACTSMLSGLNSQGQQAVARCVATGCGAGLASCIDGLK